MTNVYMMKKLLAESPVIAAVKNEAELHNALSSECRVIFLLCGNLLNIGDLVFKVRSAGKIAIVHVDLIEGLSNREIAVDALMMLSKPDGIISTRTALVRRAQSLGLVAIQRTFLIDSISFQSLLSQLENCPPDFVEVLPGIIPNVIQELTQKIQVPVIAGGLIRSKQDVIQALNAGVISISTTDKSVWEM